MRKLFKIGPDESPGGAILFSWQPEGNFLATAGSNGVVSIWDRHGEKIQGGEIECNSRSQGGGPISAVEWDCMGETVAVLQEGSGDIMLWDIKDRQTIRLETNLQNPSFLKWSKTGPELAVGTAKGNLLIYNKENRKKIPVMGKHPKKITCGAWSMSNELAMGSEDKCLTISDAEGETHQQRDMKHPPKGMCFAAQQLDGNNDEGVETHLSINMGYSLLLYELKDPDNPLELAFQQKYGQIVEHLWFDEGYIMLGFDNGYLVVISTKMQEIGEELYSARFHQSALFDVAFSPAMKLAACAGDTGVKLVDCNNGFENLKPDGIDLSGEGGQTSKVGWSPDGQILTVGTTTGHVHAFLARMRIVHGHSGPQVAYLSSLREVSVVDVRQMDMVHKQVLKIPVTIEPQFIALGAMHVAVGINNRVYYHRCLPKDTTLVDEQEYVGRVEKVCLNERYAAVLAQGTVILHEIEAGHNGSRQRRTFPDTAEGDTGRATCVAVTPSLMVYGTDQGAVEFFLLDAKEWSMLSGATLRHSTPIKALYPNPSGTRVVVVDSSNNAYLGNPVTAEMTPFPQFPTQSVKHIMWDINDAGVVMVWDSREVHTYVYAPTTRWGPMVSKLGPVEISSGGEISMRPESTPLPANHWPIVAASGVITCQDSSGNLQNLDAPTYGSADHRLNKQHLQFTQKLALLQLKEAWNAALALDGRAYWLALSNKAMEVMDMNMAIRVYRELGDAGMVMGLERIMHYEDKNLLAGHIALLYDDYNKAQELFLASTRPVTALEMRRDLLHWDQALKLAHTLAPHQVPDISVQFARQMEFKGEYESALEKFESALNTITNEEEAAGAGMGGGGLLGDKEETEKIQSVCMAGIARCTLRLGDLNRGKSYVREANDMQLCRDCARILEVMKQTGDAATLYEMGEQYERAAAIYIKTKNLTQAARIMPKVTQPKLHSEYAAKCEKDGQFEEAVRSYERARDMDAVVRLCLDQLSTPERAFEIVRSTSSSTGAQLVAHYCQREGNFRGAIEFLLMAKCSEEAFALAKTHDCMDVYTKVLGDGIGPDEAQSVASFYESQHELGQAGHFYSLCGQYARALKLFLQCGEKEVDRAIEVVGKARNDMLTHTLIDFLMGETDGVPKEPFHIYRLYLALGNYAQAAKTAIIIARQEQDLGNYRQAHSIIYETIRQLQDQKVRVPQSLRRPFTLLHSYMLVKKLIKHKNHEGAARMLLRVAKNISKFPNHVVPVLTSTVIESFRAGLKQSALEYAKMLMRPEYRQLVEPDKVKKKIESMVRKPKSCTDEMPEPLSPCPITGELIPVTSLESPTTKDAIPMCIVTGQHMVADDWCLCPNSNMPALYSEYIKYITAEAKADMTARGGDDAAAAIASSPIPMEKLKAMDPVTGTEVKVAQLKKCSADEVAAYISSYNMIDQEEPPKKA